jgi:hypothetical protein
MPWPGELRGSVSGGATSITGGTQAATGSVPVTIGDLLVCCVVERVSLTVTAVTDSLGHTYTAQNVGTDAGNPTGRTFWFIATAGGTLTSMSAALTNSTDDIIVVGAVFSGPFAASPLDANPANNNNTDVTLPLTCPLTGTLAQAFELIIGWGAVTNGRLATTAVAPANIAVTGMSSTENAANSVGATIVYQAVNATTTTSNGYNTAADAAQSIQGTMSFKFSTTFMPAQFGYDMTGINNPVNPWKDKYTPYMVPIW